VASVACVILAGEDVEDGELKFNQIFLPFPSAGTEIWQIFLRKLSKKKLLPK
jgi:hypothetical protein